MRRRFSTLAAAVLAVISMSCLAQPAFDEERYRDLLKELRCLVCQNQNLADSGASLAGDLRSIVKERMVAGDNDDAIVDYLVSRYGDYVHYRPPVSRSTLVLWFAPVALLALVLLTLIIRRRAVSEQEVVESAELERARAALRSDNDLEHRS